MNDTKRMIDLAGINEDFNPKENKPKEIAYSLDDIADELLSIRDRMIREYNVPKHKLELIDVISKALVHYADVIRKE